MSDDLPEPVRDRVLVFERQLDAGEPLDFTSKLEPAWHRGCGRCKLCSAAQPEVRRTLCPDCREALATILARLIAGAASS